MRRLLIPLSVLALMTNGSGAPRSHAQAASAGLTPVSDTDNAGVGSITGAVTDVTGAAIPGAVVVARNAHNTTQSTTSDSTGRFTFKNVASGAVDITVTKDTFAISTLHLDVAAGGTTSLDVQMQALAEASTVNVFADKVNLIETGTSAVSNTLDEQEVKSYPTNGRNFLSFISLSAGVSNQTGQDEIKVGVVGSAKFAVNGGRTEYNSFLIDGSDVLNTDVAASHGQSNLIVYPSIDSIRELKVLTSNYGAEYGRSASGTVLVSTLSGQARFHGSGYEFIRNEFFNARNYFDQASPKAPLYRRNDFGGSFGGPLFVPNVFNTHKDKSFFFISEEFRKERSPQQFNQGVPSDAERGYNILTHTQTSVADFSDVCPTDVNFFSPSKYPDCPGRAGNSTFNFAGLTQNQFRISPTALAYLKSGLLPRANANRGCVSSIESCYDVTISPSTDYRQDLGRLDQTLPFQSNLSLVVVHDHWTTVVATPQWAAHPNSFPSVQNSFVGPGLSAIAHLTTLLSKSTLNDFSYGYTLQRIRLGDIPGPGVSLDPSGVLATGIGNIFGASTTKLPGLVFAGNNPAYGGNGFNADTSYEPWSHTLGTQTIRDAFSYLGGKHSLLLGVQLVHARRTETSSFNGANTGNTQGTLTFSNVANPQSTNNVFADFLLGDGNSSPAYIRSFSQDNAAAPYSVHYWTIEPYIQDDWKVTPRLTLNLGFRASLFYNWEPEKRDLFNWVESSYDPSAIAAAGMSVNFSQGYLQNSATADPIPFEGSIYNQLYNGLQVCGSRTVPSSCQTSHVFNPAPRLGLAWDPSGKGLTSIRAGYGVFFEHGTGSEANAGSLVGNPPYVLSVEQSYPSSYATIGVPGPPYQTGITPAFPLNTVSIPKKTIWPYVQQWSLGIQQQLNSATGLSIAYVGSKGTHLATEFQRNQLAGVPSAQNPFSAGQPIQRSDCNSLSLVAGAPFSSADSFFINGNTIRYTDAPNVFLSLLAACNGTPPTYNGSTKTNLGLGFDPNYVRPFQGIGRIETIKNVASSVYHSAQLSIRRNRGRLDVALSYTFSHSIDSASDRYESTFVNAYDLAANRASSSFDQRHILNVNYIYQLPLLPVVHRLRDIVQCSPGSMAEGDTNCPTVSSYSGPSRVTQAALSGWSVSGITLFQTGTPFSVVNDFSPNGVSALDNAGLLIGGSADSYADRTTRSSACKQAFPSIDARQAPGTFGPIIGSPCDFQAPRGLTQGNTGRNYLNNPGRTNFDVALLKRFALPREATSLEFRADVFNVFNHTQFIVYDPNRGNTAANTISCYGDEAAGFSAGAASCLTGNGFLRPISAHRPRTMQFGLKLAF